VASETNWSVAEGERNGLPVIVRFIAEMPSAETRGAYRWLTVISWSYAPGESGMPRPEDNQRMYDLEDALEASLESKGYCIQVISRTGGGIREYSYYIREREEFIDALNGALANKPRFPIEINFYEDPAWSELQNLYQSVTR
jgi:hypothetical protein